MKSVKVKLCALLLVFLASAFFAAGLNPAIAAPTGQTPSSKIIKDVGDEYFEWMKQDTLYLRVRFGLKVEHLPEITLAKAERDGAHARFLLSRLEGVRPEELNHEEELSLDVLRLRLQNQVESLRFYWLMFPVTPYSTPINEANSMFESYIIKDKPSADHYLELLQQYPVFISQILEMLREQVARGIVLPREELDLTVLYLRAISGPIETSPLGVKPARIKALSTAETQSFQTNLAKILDERINPSLNSLVSYLDGDYRKKAPEEVGLGQYPGGKDFYAWLVKYHTSLDITPEKVHEIGLREVEKLNTAIDKVQATLGVEGTRAEFRDALKKNSRFFPKTPEEVGQRLMAYIQRIEPQIGKYFLRRPKAPYAVKRLEPEREGSQTFGYYQAPTAADPTGYYRYNASNLPERSLLNAAELIYHELIPGHHFELSLAAENLSIPAFRRETYDNAYAEGWAEYAATLAGEMGMYADPYDLLGWLAGEIFLATRLVVDPGMNALGWSRAKAVAFMRENCLESEEQIQTESLRYSCDIPGQALGYRLGYLKFLELREKAEKALGKRFDIRRFHEALLGSGSLPLGTLERHIDWFIQKEKEAK